MSKYTDALNVWEQIKQETEDESITPSRLGYAGELILELLNISNIPENVIPIPSTDGKLSASGLIITPVSGGKSIGLAGQLLKNIVLKPDSTEILGGSGALASIANGIVELQAGYGDGSLQLHPNYMQLQVDGYASSLEMSYDNLHLRKGYSEMLMENYHEQSDPNSYQDVDRLVLSVGSRNLLNYTKTEYAYYDDYDGWMSNTTEINTLGDDYVDLDIRGAGLTMKENGYNFLTAAYGSLSLQSRGKNILSGGSSSVSLGNGSFSSINIGGSNTSISAVNIGFGHSHNLIKGFMSGANRMAAFGAGLYESTFGASARTVYVGNNATNFVGIGLGCPEVSLGYASPDVTIGEHYNDNQKVKVKRGVYPILIAEPTFTRLYNNAGGEILFATENLLSLGYNRTHVWMGEGSTYVEVGKNAYNTRIAENASEVQLGYLSSTVAIGYEAEIVDLAGYSSESFFGQGAGLCVVGLDAVNLIIGAGATRVELDSPTVITTDAGSFVFVRNGTNGNLERMTKANFKTWLNS